MKPRCHLAEVEEARIEARADGCAQLPAPEGGGGSLAHPGKCLSTPSGRSYEQCVPAVGPHTVRTHGAPRVNSGFDARCTVRHRRRTPTTLYSTQAVPQPSLRGPEPDECEVLLIRHGRSADVVPGFPESADPPLHLLGIEQAAKLAARLACKQIHAVYSSQLARARQTAQPLADARGLPVVEHIDLEEVRMGDWGNGEFLLRRAAIAYQPVAWSRTGRWDGIPGGEGDAASAAGSPARSHTLVLGNIVASASRSSHTAARSTRTSRTCWASTARCRSRSRTLSITSVRIGQHGQTPVTVNDCHHLYDPVLP